MPADLPSTNLKSAGITPKELEMAESLVMSMTGSWKPESYHDKYRDMLMKWIEKKAKAGGAMPVAEPEEEEDEAPGKIINITHLLQQSLQKHGGSRARNGATRRAAKPLRRSAG